MKKFSKLISIGLLLGIVGTLCIGTSSALTPEGIWGMSTGDELFYKMTLKDGPFEVAQYEKISVTKIETNTITFNTTEYNCNFVYAITYVYNGTEWVESNPEVEWAGYNNVTAQYYGAYQLCLGFPRSSFLPFDLYDVWDVMYDNAIYAGWGPSTVTSSFFTGWIHLHNSTDNLWAHFDTTSGVCKNITHYVDGELYSSQIYLGDVDPFYVEPPPEPKIPGFNPIILVSTLGITSLLVGLKIKKK